MIKDIIAKGIGFTPTAVKFIVTHGYLAAAAGVVKIPRHLPMMGVGR